MKNLNTLNGNGVSLVTTLAPPVIVPENTVASFSDLGKFGQCRRAWYLATYRKLRLLDEPPTGPLPFGSRIHSALEAFYDGTVDSPVTAWKALMQHEYIVAEANGNPYTDSLDKESDLGHRMLEGYIEWLDEEGEDAYFETLSVEEALIEHLPMVVDIDGVPHEVSVLVRGKLDRRLRRLSDGAIYINDFKTMANFAETSIFSLEQSPQPRIYRRLLLANSLEGETDVRGVVYTLLRKVKRTATAKPPFYKRVTIEISDIEQAAYDARLQGAVEQVVQAQVRLDRGEDHRRVAFFNTGWWCNSCPFKNPCQLMQSSPQGAEDMLANLYTEGDPWARYLMANGGAPDDAESTTTF